MHGDHQRKSGLLATIVGPEDHKKPKFTVDGLGGPVVMENPLAV